MIKMFLQDDVIYQILLWLPVMSLLRFKLISRSLCKLIENDDFIKEHLYHHHHNPILKDKNHHLIYRVPGNYPPINFPLTSIDNFEAPNKCLKLDCPELHESFPIEVYDIMSFNGIVCLNICIHNGKQCICIWNPATKNSRLLPLSPFPFVGRRARLRNTTVGFGFDVKASEYKVVNLIGMDFCDEKRVEIYSFSMNSWRSVTIVHPNYLYIVGPGMPFNKGTCFCWIREDFLDYEILCFDFVTEMFRSLPFPNVEHHLYRPHLGVVKDKIACVFNVDVDFASETDVWVFIEYGSIDENWVKICRIHPYSTIHYTMSAVFLSMKGEYIFFKRWDRFCRYNIVTGDIKILRRIENYEDIFMDSPLPHPNMYYMFHEAILEFKESLVSIW